MDWLWHRYYSSSTINRRQLAGFCEISKFPVVRRDLAILVNEEVSVQDILDALRHEAPEYVIEVALFDHYRGKGIEKGKKSLAFRVLLQDTQKTLTDEEVNLAIATLRKLLEQKYSARLRE